MKQLIENFKRNLLNKTLDSNSPEIIAFLNHIILNNKQGEVKFVKTKECCSFYIKNQFQDSFPQKIFQPIQERLMICCSQKNTEDNEFQIRDGNNKEFISTTITEFTDNELILFIQSKPLVEFQ